MSPKKLIDVFDRVGLDYLSNLVPKLYLKEYNNMVAMGDVDFATATLVDEVIAANEKVFAKDDAFNQLIDGTLDASNLDELGAIMYGNITKYIKENHNGISLHNNNDSQNTKGADITSIEQVRDGNIHQTTGKISDNTRRGGPGYDSASFDGNGTHDASNDRATNSKSIDNQQAINLDLGNATNGIQAPRISPTSSNQAGVYEYENDTKRVERTYIHEVVGHQFIDKLIKKNQREMLFDAVVDDIGIEHMR